MIKKTFLFLIFLATSNLSFSQESSIELPLIGDRLSGAVSQTEEESLGRQFLRDLKRETPILYDPIVQEWTELFVYKVGEQSKVNKKASTILVSIGADKSPKTQRPKKPPSKTDNKNIICWFLNKLFNFIFY